MQDDHHQDDAFIELYERYHPRLVRTCRRMLGEHAHDAEAVAQEAFLRAWRAAARFAPDRPFWPWVSTIARRLCLDYLRRIGRDERIEERTKHLRLIALPEPDEGLTLVDDQVRMREAVASLSDRHQRLVRLHHVDGWSYQEIARYEGISLESVRGALKRARSLLRAAYEEQVRGLAVVPGLAWLRHLVDRLVPWAARVAQTRPPKLALGALLANALVALLVGASLQGVGPPSPGPSTAGPTPTDPIAPVGDAGTAPAASSTAGTASASRTTSSAPVTTTPVDDIGEGSPQQYTFEHVAVAPNDEVYAIGYARREGRQDEGFVAHSDDGGRTWATLPHNTFLGNGRFSFPPAFPDDPRIFVSGPLGTAVSHDRAKSFHLMSPISGWAAMSPRSSAGHPVFLAGNAPGWFYDASGIVAVPTGLPLPASATPATFAFGPTYGEDGTVYVAGSTFLDSAANAGAMPPVVFVCRASGCTEAARDRKRSMGGALELVVAPDGRVWAFNKEVLWRSVDGTGFEALPLPAPMTMPAAVVTHGEATYLSLTQDAFRRGGIYRSLDDGDTWEKVGGDTFPHGAPTLAVLKDGTLLAVQHPVSGGGLLRSADSGTSWQKVL